MKNQIKIALAIFLFGLATSSASAAFTSFHVFGDSISTTATNSGAGQYYYGKRYSNGRVWVEVLAQQQGLAFDPAGNTNSYFGNTSSSLLAEVNAYRPPTDAGNALVVIWVNNADLYYPALDPLPTLAKFTSAINVALTNQFKAITNLYAKGIRTLIMPNVVDISAIPQFNTYTAYTNLFHQASTNYNAAFYATLDRARISCPGLQIFVPDFFALLTNLLTYPANYGLINAQVGGRTIDAINAANYGLPLANINGYGTNYVFWDPTDPTAKVHYIMANIAQQLVSPVQISGLAVLNGSNRLDVLNMPVGMDGFVEGSTNLLSGWTAKVSFTSKNTVQSVFVPNPSTSQVSQMDLTPPGDSTGLAFFPPQLYRLSFPANWVWP